MPTARAKIGDLVLAETDTWETVDGNVYVRRGNSDWSQRVAADRL